MKERRRGKKRRKKKKSVSYIDSYLSFLFFFFCLLSSIVWSQPPPCSFMSSILGFVRAWRTRRLVGHLPWDAKSTSKMAKLVAASARREASDGMTL